MRRSIIGAGVLVLAGGSFLAAPGAPRHVWKPARAQVAAARKIGRPVFLTNSIGMKFALIPAGSFLMGSPPTELERGSPDSGGEEAEGPQHLVVISRPLYMQRTEVTQAQYRAIIGKNPSRFRGCDRCPVERVSWHDAREFIRRLNAREKTNKYRLPTEAEWEYACRAGTTTPFSFGRTISTRQANYNGEYVYGRGRKGVWRRKTTRAGSFPPNRWGLSDMHGNVWEWCQDWYHYAYYKKSPTRDPQGPALAVPSPENSRATRGGSWRNHPRSLRSARRDCARPTYRDDMIGFRVVRMP
jgi:formylglycine-generating enzyme required for sulfatase activity